MDFTDVWSMFKEEYGNKDGIIIPVGSNPDETVYLDLTRTNVLVRGSYERLQRYANALIYGIALTEDSSLTKIIIAGSNEHVPFNLPHFNVSSEKEVFSYHNHGDSSLMLEWISNELHRRLRLKEEQYQEKYWSADFEETIVVVLTGGCEWKRNSIEPLLLKGKDVGMHVIANATLNEVSESIESLFPVRIDLENDELFYSDDQIKGKKLRQVVTDRESWEDLIHNIAN